MLISNSRIFYLSQLPELVSILSIDHARPLLNGAQFFREAHFERPFPRPYRMGPPFAGATAPPAARHARQFTSEQYILGVLVVQPFPNNCVLKDFQVRG